MQFQRLQLTAGNKVKSFSKNRPIIDFGLFQIKVLKSAVPKRPSVPPEASVVLLIDGMPECDSQHVMNAGTRDLTTGITCDPEHARVGLSWQLFVLPFISLFLFIHLIK